MNIGISLKNIVSVALYICKLVLPSCLSKDLLTMELRFAVMRLIHLASMLSVCNLYV